MPTFNTQELLNISKNSENHMSMNQEKFKSTGEMLMTNQNLIKLSPMEKPLMALSMLEMS